MKLHERSMKVQAATAGLKLQIIEFADEHDLTAIELVRALAEVQEVFTRQILRAERHPDDPSQKADEE